MNYSNLWDAVEKAERIGISGHARPDGDCIGSCLGLVNYIADNYGKKADLYIDEIPASFTFLKGSEDIISGYPDAPKYDLFILLDCGDLERTADAAKYFKAADYTFCIDHHATNKGYADVDIIDGDSAATAELLCSIMDADKISLDTANCLYLGIVHDTGVFKHSNTRRQTMELAGMLLEKGVNAGNIIDKTFYEKTYVQNQILGRTLMESILLMDGKIIASYVSLDVQKLYGISNSDMEGIVDQLRVTKGIEVAILLKEVNKREWKVSLRSNNIVDVSLVAVKFAGGGHVRAAGCTLHGSVYDVLNSLTREIEKQMVE
ncbi:MAG: bifunctional oligoribonuclease/PAP phosphatase NrnA [Lachnospiraceae bacterium]|nr:bifunctional oligoribonuclease/PAP phosphatase NrnA [Lachnospiraceae bacterium]